MVGRVYFKENKGVRNPACKLIITPSFFFFFENLKSIVVIQHKNKVGKFLEWDKSGTFFRSEFSTFWIAIWVQSGHSELREYSYILVR